MVPLHTLFLLYNKIFSSSSFIFVSLNFSLSHADNGTYLCHGENDYGTSVAVMENVVFDKPEVKLDAVEAVGVDKVFFNWTVNDWNSPVSDYFLSVR